MEVMNDFWKMSKVDPFSNYIYMCYLWTVYVVVQYKTCYQCPLHAHCSHTCSSKSECNELRSANSKLKDELEQLKEKYHSQLGDGVRTKREVYNM